MRHVTCDMRHATSRSQLFHRSYSRTGRLGLGKCGKGPTRNPPFRHYTTEGKNNLQRKNKKLQREVKELGLCVCVCVCVCVGWGCVGVSTCIQTPTNCQGKSRSLDCVCVRVCVFTYTCLHTHIHPHKKTNIYSQLQSPSMWRNKTNLTGYIWLYMDIFDYI